MDITGVLLYSDQQFVQYLEGDHKDILALYDKIKEDDRHRNAVMISSGPIKERSFPSWQMGAKQFESNEVEYRTDINETEKREFKAILDGEKQENHSAIQLVKKLFK